MAYVGGSVNLRLVCVRSMVLAMVDDLRVVSVPSNWFAVLDRSTTSGIGSFKLIFSIVEDLLSVVPVSSQVPVGTSLDSVVIDPTNHVSVVAFMPSAQPWLKEQIDEVESRVGINSNH